MPYKNKEAKQNYLKEYRKINGKQIDERRAGVLKEKFDKLNDEEKFILIQKRREIAKKSYYKHRERYLKERKETAYKYYIKSHYGLTYDDYLCLLEAQDYKCAICGCDEFENNWTSRKIPFSVDHCHENNKVRGLLCDNCNVLLGHAKDDVNILQNAIKYLWKQEDTTKEN